MGAESNVFAIIFDFDDTLTPDSTSILLKKYGLNPKEFWEVDVNRLTKQGWEPAIAYPQVILRYIEEGKLPPITSKELKDFGATLKPYSGLEWFLDDLRGKARKLGFQLEYYIISGGIQDIIEGFRVREEFKAVWGSQFAFENPEGPIKFVKRAITFTEKTKYLFIINKGLDLVKAAGNPYLVNEFVDHAERRIPFRNMIYVGDGQTDIACFSIVSEPRREGVPGLAFAVVHPDNEKSEKMVWIELVSKKRVTAGCPPEYGKKGTLGSALRTNLLARCMQIKSPTVKYE